jgi:PadR family transcriptional regulator, regulatory protein PadR
MHVNNNYNVGHMRKLPNLGEFEQVVLLAILQLQTEGAYGVSIREKIAEHTKRDPAPGAIYTTLERLESKTLVRSTVGEGTPQRGGRAKRYYHVTAQGIAALKHARQAFESLSRGLTVLGESKS